VLSEVLDLLDERHIGFAMARVRTEVRDELDRSGLEARFSRQKIYLEVSDAADDYLASRETNSST
jgi:SulP family sulfate permease